MSEQLRAFEDTVARVLTLVDLKHLPEARATLTSLGQSEPGRQMGLLSTVILSSFQRLFFSFTSLNTVATC